MHQTRAHVTTKIPINRKGTQYVARASSHKSDSVPVIIAVRDMLHLAKTAKEVNEMIKDRLLKINHKAVKDYRESIKLFNILEAGKTYRLTILPTNKYSFEEISKTDPRLCKVTDKKLLNNNVLQLNLHDGTNLVTKSKISTNDSVYLDSENKIKSHVAFEKGKKAFIISGKYTGKHGVIKEIKSNGVLISFDKEGSAVLNKNQLVAM